MEGYAGPSDAGILLADRLGYFAEAGVNLTINGAIRPEYSIEYAAEGNGNVVVTQMPEVVRADAEGKQVVVLGSILTEPALAMIWLEGSGIRNVADLKGKTIAIPGATYQRAFLEYVLKGAGLAPGDVEVRIVRKNTARALERGRADAVFGATWNADGAALESRGLEPVVTKATALGIPAYEELVLTTQRSSFEKNPELYRRILAATARGAVAVEEDPGAGSEAIVDKTLELAPPKPTLAGVEATAPLLSKTGEVDRAKLKDLVDWMHGQGMTERKVPVARLLAEPADGAEQPPTEKPRSQADITLNGRPGPETSGLMLAKRRGYFSDAGLRTFITKPGTPSAPITYAVSGGVDVIVTQEPELVLARSEGYSLVAFGSVVSRPTMAMIWLRGSGVDGIADLKGRTIAYPGVAVQKAFLETALSTAGLELDDVKLEAVGDDLRPALERGRADAIFGGSGNVEGAALEARGLEPVVTPVTEFGAPGYDELVLVARPGLLAADPGLAQRVLRAVIRGNTAVKRDSAAGHEALVESKSELEVLKGIGNGVEATAPLLSATGEIDPARLSRLVAWMHDEGMIDSEIPVSQLVAGGDE